MLYNYITLNPSKKAEVMKYLFFSEFKTTVSPICCPAPGLVAIFGRTVLFLVASLEDLLRRSFPFEINLSLITIKTNQKQKEDIFKLNM